jgi:hypothetical protein
VCLDAIRRANPRPALGCVPRQHRTYHLSAAIAPLDAEGPAQARERYRLLMTYYGLEATTNNVGVAHENGDVEQEHFRFKQAVDQALRARGSRDFADRAAYARFLQNQVKQCNLRRQARWLEEREALRPLPVAPLALCREVRVPVSRFSTIRVLRNTYSVPSRLIGSTLLVRVRSGTLEVYRATTHLLTMPRLLGHGQHRIDYRHVIWSLVRKPGAFAHYRYRDGLFPSVVLHVDCVVQSSCRRRIPSRVLPWGEVQSLATTLECESRTRMAEGAAACRRGGLGWSWRSYADLHGQSEPLRLRARRYG